MVSFIVDKVQTVCEMYDYGRANKTVKPCLQIFTLAYIHINQTPPFSVTKCHAGETPPSLPKRDIINEWPVRAWTVIIAPTSSDLTQVMEDYAPEPDLGEGPGGPGPRPPTRGASRHTAHILFLANKSADDFCIDALLQFASVQLLCTEIAVQEDFAPSPQYDFWRDLRGGLKKFLRSLSLAIF